MNPLTKTLRAFCTLVALAGPLSFGACQPLGAHVSQGQLYSTGEAAYDPYFREVHEAQVEAASWADERRASHKPLVTALTLTPDAQDVTVVQATHERSGKYAPSTPASARAGGVRLELTGTDAKVTGRGADGEGAPLFRAVEETTHAELERAKRLDALVQALEALRTRGHDLEPHVRPDFIKYGPKRVDEVMGELLASEDALAKLASNAHAERRGAVDFVADLQRSLESAPGAPAEAPAKVPHRVPPPAHAPPPPAKAPPHATPSVAREPKETPPPSDEAVAVKPPPPKPAEPTEVFNP